MDAKAGSLIDDAIATVAERCTRFGRENRTQYDTADLRNETRHLRRCRDRISTAAHNSGPGVGRNYDAERWVVRAAIVYVAIIGLEGSPYCRARPGMLTVPS
jgi:hypothetical protein